MKGEIFVINDHVQISQGAETWFINVVDNSVICDAMEVVWYIHIFNSLSRSQLLHRIVNVEAIKSQQTCLQELN